MNVPRVYTPPPRSGARATGRPRLLPWLCLIPLCAALIIAPVSRAADDDSVSTGKRVLGVTLGSVNGALAARALTYHHERTPTVALIFAGAVGGGAAIGYATAGNDDALVAMGILLIPLTVLNVVLPSSSYPFDSTAGLPAGMGGTASHPELGLADASARSREGAAPTADWWSSALWRAVPQPTAHGLRLTPVRMRF